MGRRLLRVLADVDAVAFWGFLIGNGVKDLVERHRPAPADALRYCDAGTLSISKAPARKERQQIKLLPTSSLLEANQLTFIPVLPRNTFNDPPMHVNKAAPQEIGEVESELKPGGILKKILIVHIPAQRAP